MRELSFELIRCDYAGANIGIYKVWEGPALRAAVPILHVHEEYEIHVMLEGSYAFTVEDASVPLHKRQILILAPGTKHYSYDHTGDGKLVSLHLFLEKTDEVDGFYSYFRRSLDAASCMPLTASRSLIQCITEFEEAPTVFTVDVYCRLKVLVSQILYHLFNDINGFGDEKTRLKSTHRVHSREYLVECLVNEPSYSLADISARTGYSLRHTTRIIQSMYGKTLTEIRTERAIDRAKALLVTTDKTVEEIATESGFGSASAMRRAFLKRVKMSPSAYREQGGNNPKGE